MKPADDGRPTEWWLLPRTTSPFHSRPDIVIPYLNITTLDPSAIAPGFIFIAPFKNTISGPLIYDHNGGLVWTGSDGFATGAGGGPHVYMFEPCQYTDTAATLRPVDHLCMVRSINDGGSGRGQAFILDSSYVTVKAIQFSGASPSVDLHEFKLVQASKDENQTSAIMTQYRPIPADLRRYGVSGVGWVHDSVFQEQRLSDGAVTFEWAASDHIAFDEAAIAFYEGTTPNEPWDFFHINSVQKLEGGDYLVGARHTSAIYRISGKDGSIIWRLGGRKSDFGMAKRQQRIDQARMGPGTAGDQVAREDEDDGWFYYQHHATLLSNDTGVLKFSIFDNGRTQSRARRPYSRGILLSVDEKAGTASVLAEYYSPAAPRQAELSGGMQVLENGNVLVAWGNTGCLSEYTAAPESQLVFEACLLDKPSPALYRAYKTPAWQGRPSTRPAVGAFASEATGSAATTLYLSWNGATEVARWRVYGALDKAEDASRWTELGTHVRTGFETLIVYPNHWPFVYAEALDADDRVLEKSAVVRTFAPLQSHDGCKDTWCSPQGLIAQPTPNMSTHINVKVIAKERSLNDLYIEVGLFAILALFIGSYTRQRFLRVKH